MVSMRNRAVAAFAVALCVGLCSTVWAAEKAAPAKAKPKTSSAAKSAPAKAAKSAPAKAAKPDPAKAAKPVSPPVPSGTLVAVPAELRFNSTHGVAQVAIFFDETPAKAAHISKAAFRLKGYMFDVTPSKTDPAVITVAANPNTAEDGSYTLEIVAGGQTINVEVYVNLSSGVSVSERTELPAHLAFDATYKKGTTLEYKLEAPLDAEYVWTVNGKVVAQGPGEIKLTYTFEETGPQIVRVGMKTPNGTTFESVGQTEVIP